VKEKVREDVLRAKAVDAATAKAASVAASFKSGDFEKAAKAAGVELRTTELVPRGTPLPDVGQSDRVDAAVFLLPAGSVTDPIATDNAVIIAKVVERDEVTPEELAQGRAALREQLLNEQRNRFFSSYMTNAKQKMKIEINRNVLRQIVA
jgi:parvulin-like peptidyl-prolyl isomerase